MRLMQHTTAIAVVLGAFAFGAQAQEQNEDKEQVAAGKSVCDTPWAQVDANDDGMVTQMEATNDIDVYFGQIDKDEDGNITRVEYVDCLTTAEDATAVEADRNEDAFDQADVDNSGEVDRREFAAAAEGAFEDSRTATASTDDSDAYVVLRRFVWLTPEEAEDGSLMQEMTKDEAAARSAMTFAALDENNDDIVDTQEWQESEPTSGRTEEWASARFDEIDADASGSVSKEEYKQARSKMLDEMTTSSTSTKKGAADSDTDEPAASTDASSTSSEDADIPVYVYRFWTM